jgi:predicted Ser/Thr protein kinase/regulation of enolase protein 1 (concanavalin A-like superfamily)
LAHYRVRRLIGSGGMGLVFLADDTLLNRPVALKVIRPELAGVPQAVVRFAREARAAAAIRHDNVVTIYQVGEAGGVAFIAMEYLQGTSLQRWLERGKRPSVELLIRLAREITAGLNAAHRMGMVHRDIKPGNIWLEAPQGRVKILDFGQARAEREDVQITQSGAILGTPAFMSPEQAAGEPVEASSDLFSLGCVLYRLATGQLPFPGRTIIAVLHALSNQTPTRPRQLNPKLPRALDELIMRLLEKAPERRPASALAVLEALDEIERQLAAARQARELGLLGEVDREPLEVVATLPEEEAVRSEQTRRRRVAGLDGRLAAGVFGIGGVVLAVFLAWPWKPAEREPLARATEDPPKVPIQPQPGVEDPTPAEPGESEPKREAPLPGPVIRDEGRVAMEPVPARPVGLVGSTLRGEFIDPDRDCAFRLNAEGDGATIAVPGTAHLLSIERGWINAPRLLRSVASDFDVTVRVGGIEPPGRKASTPLYPAYHGAGLLIWQDERNYFRFELAEGYLEGRPRRFLNYEYRQDGQLVASHGRVLDRDRDQLYLRLTRRGSTLMAAYGPDGITWTDANPLLTTFAETVSVGLVAINSSLRPLEASFSEYKLDEPDQAAPMLGVQVRLTPARASFGVDEAVEVGIEIVNQTSAPVAVPGDRGGEQRYRLLVTDVDGRPRARSRDEPFGETLGPVTVLPAAGKLSDRIVIKPEGDQWKPGPYTIRIDVVLLGVDGRPIGMASSQPAEFRIEAGERPSP